MSSTFDSIVKIENDIADWKKWETNYSNMLSQNNGQRKTFERQISHAVFMQEIKHKKLHRMRQELNKQEIELLTFMFPGCF